MAKKTARPTPATKCRCNHCGVEAHAIPNKPHRRCTGTDKLAEKGSYLKPASARGVWQSA